MTGKKVFDFGRTLTVDLDAAAASILGQPSWRGPSCLCGHGEWCESCSPMLHVREQELQRQLANDIADSVAVQRILRKSVSEIVLEQLKNYQIRKL